jgi:TRAP-type C4-dicarboxylate transport system permease small subunit
MGGSSVQNILGERGLADRLSTLLALAGAVGVLLIAAIVVVDVLARALFNAPILAVDDLNPYNIAVAIAAFFPLCMVGRHFVTIRFLGRALGLRAHLALELFGAVVTLAAFILYAWQMLRYALKATFTGEASGILEIPQAPWWWLVAAILTVSVLVQAAVVVEAVLALRSGDVKPAGSADHGA